MSEKWTKGPWRVCPPGAGVPHYDVCERVVSDHPSGRAVHIDPISDADAHLIAAAPDLYRALEALLDKADREWDADGGGIWPETRNDARAALTKARDVWLWCCVE